MSLQEVSDSQRFYRQEANELSDSLWETAKNHVLDSTQEAARADEGKPRRGHAAFEHARHTPSLGEA
ncbi:MAG: hypothetical protein ACQKBU_04255 [Verrucomicrobiales bacterium]